MRGQVYVSRGTGNFNLTFNYIGLKAYPSNIERNFDLFSLGLFALKDTGPRNPVVR